MKQLLEKFDSYSYSKRFLIAAIFLLPFEFIQVAIRHNAYFSDPKETKWLFFRDTLAFIAFTLLLARKTKKNTDD